MIIEIKNKYKLNKKEAKKIIREILREEKEEAINPYLMRKAEIDSYISFYNKVGWEKRG